MAKLWSSLFEQGIEASLQKMFVYISKKQEIRGENKQMSASVRNNDWLWMDHRSWSLSRSVEQWMLICGTEYTASSRKRKLSTTLQERTRTRCKGTMN